MLASFITVILGALQNEDRPNPEVLSYEAFSTSRNDPAAILGFAFSIVRRKTDASYAKYSQGKFTKYQAAVDAETEAKTAYTEANDVAADGNANARAARELRISQTHHIWQGAEQRLERLEQAQTPLLSPLQTLVPLFNTAEASEASAANNLYALNQEYEKTAKLPSALRIIFDDALNKVTLDHETPVPRTLMRFQDALAVRHLCWPEATPLEDATVDALFHDLIRRAHNGSGMQFQSMANARSDAGLPDIDVLSRAELTAALHKKMLLSPKTWPKSKGATGAVGTHVTSPAHLS